MAFVIGLLTFFIVLDCLILILLVLIQLPKKEAGVGVAFGGAATDALFGAGSGNVLTKTTKYAAACFFALAIVLSVLQSRLYHRSTSEFRQELERQGQQAPAPAPTTPSTPGPTVPETPTTSTGINLLTPELNVTNTPPSPPPR
jgi:preprotein translocase subunit SecG